MSCLDPTAASEFVEGVLSDDERRAIEAHLADCADCRELMAVIAAATSKSQAPAEPQERKSAAPTSFLDPGTEVGRFVVRERLGRGGMGVVYRAYDPELERDVAIKLLRFDYGGDRGAEAEARLLREARAMARLSHPNVVTVYEVGSEAGYVFIAMELLSGATLEDWLAAEPRSRRAICNAMAGAGRGLLAAHEAGMVHRDFKPTNIIVDEVGEATVLDFGLVGGDEFVETTDAEFDSESSIGTSSGSLTRTGALLGTPAYMAPEQHLGEPLGPETDQWAFAVCLYQALTDEHPFAAGNLNKLRKKVLAGTARPLPKRIPRRIRRAIMRGLRREPEQRYASMHDMVRAIDSPVTRPWGWALVAGAAVAVAGTQIYLSQSAAEEVCSGSEERAAEVWNDQSEATMRAKFDALGLSFAKTTADRVGQNLKQYFNRWAQLRRETCRAARVHRELPEPAMERAMACLERRMGEARALTEQLLAPTREVVANAERATERLVDLESCSAQGRLAAIDPAPDTADARLDDLEAGIAGVKALIDLGRISAGLERARVVAKDAEAAGYDVINARARFWLGRALEVAGLYAEADEALRESAHMAMATGDDRQLTLSATALVRVVGFRKADADRGNDWQNLARAALTRSGQAGTKELTRQLDLAEASLHAASGDFAEAERLSRVVLEQVTAEFGADDVRVAEAHSAVGNYCEDQYRYECGEEHFQKALDIWKGRYGDTHPTVAGALTDLGTTAAAQGKFELALERHRKAIAIREAGLGPNHPDLGSSYHNIGYPLIATGKLDEALAACEKALAINRVSLGDSHPRNAATLYTMGYLFWTQKRYDEAYSSHFRALEIRSAAFGADHAYVGDIHIELGRTRRDQKRYADAAAHYEKSLAIRRRQLGSKDNKTIYTLTDLGSMFVKLGDAKRALPLLEEADNHWRENKGGVGEMRAMNSFYLAQAIWDSGGSKERARKLAREGLAGYEAIANSSGIADAKSWIARH